MLTLPPSSEPLRVLGVDPGTSTLGVSVLEWDVTQPVFRVCNAFTLIASDRHSIYGNVTEFHGSRMARIQHHGDELFRVLQHERPHVVIAESPFMGRFANSFMALTEMLWVIRSTLQQYDPHLPLYTIDPMRAKEAVGVILRGKRKGELSKEDVRTALLTRTDVQWFVDPRALDEHSIDATAVGLYYLLRVA